MDPQTLEFLKVVGSFGGGAAGAISGVLLKQWLDQRDVRAVQRQTRWLPLLEASHALRNRLEELTARYENQLPEMPWLVYDFWELYTLDPKRKPFSDLEDPALEDVLDQSRTKMLDVQRVRRRMCHQLNYAVSSLYITAKYLGYAERVRRDLAESRLRLPDRATGEKVLNEINDVRQKLHGVSTKHPGSGVIFEQQESIAENIWDDNKAITYFAFRQKLLDQTGWEQFIGLFRFFVHFQEKIGTEVSGTTSALGNLTRTIEVFSE